MCVVLEIFVFKRAVFSYLIFSIVQCYKSLDDVEVMRESSNLFMYVET